MSDDKEQSNERAIPESAYYVAAFRYHQRAWFDLVPHYLPIGVLTRKNVQYLIEAGKFFKDGFMSPLGAFRAIKWPLSHKDENRKTIMKFSYPIKSVTLQAVGDGRDFSSLFSNHCTIGSATKDANAIEMTLTIPEKINPRHLIPASVKKISRGNYSVWGDVPRKDRLMLLNCIIFEAKLVMQYISIVREANLEFSGNNIPRYAKDQKSFFSYFGALRTSPQNREEWAEHQKQQGMNSKQMATAWNSMPIEKRQEIDPIKFSNVGDSAFRVGKSRKKQNPADKIDSQENDSE